MVKQLLRNKEVKNASWIVCGKIIQMILSFFVGVLTARYLGPGQYGVINYVAAYIAFFSSFCTLGLNSIIIKDFSDNEEEQGTSIGTSIGLRIISSFFSAIMIVSIIYFIDGNDFDFVIIAILSSIALLFQVFDTLNYWFQFRYESKVTSLATLIAYIITSLYRVVLLFFEKDVIWFALATSIDYIIIAIVLIYIYKKKNGPKFHFSLKKAQYLLKNSYHYILAGMMVVIYGQTDKMMLKQMLSEEAVGFYSLASTINNMWVFVLAAIIDSLSPTIIRLHNDNKELYEKKNRLLYAIVIYLSLFVAVGFMIFGELFIKIVYGIEYLPTASVLKVICWYTAFSYLGVARNVWVVCENCQRYIKYLTCGAAFANVILNVFFIPLFGAVGAATASLITQILTIVILPLFISEMRPNVKLMKDALLLKKIK